MDRHGASPNRKVEAGINAILNAHLHIGRGSQTVQAIKPYVRLEQLSASWDIDTQEAFILKLTNTVRSPFDQPDMSLLELQRIPMMQ